MAIPTILGIPDRPNTSDKQEANRHTTGTILKSRVSKYKEILTKTEIKDTTIIFSNLMKKLNYTPEPVSTFYQIFRWRFLISRVIVSNLILKLKSRG